MKQVWGDQPKLFSKVQSNRKMFKNWQKIKKSSKEKKRKEKEQISAKYKKREKNIQKKENISMNCKR